MEELRNRDQTDEKGPPTERSVTGRILFERFLVLADVSDPESSRRISSYFVKDLRNACRQAILRSFHGLAIEGLQSSPTLREVCETLIRVKHPNIEEMIEAGVLYDGSPYCLASVAHGLPLSYLLDERNRFDLTDISRFVDEFSEGVSAAHGRGIIHCDIRPSNVFVQEPDSIHKGLQLVNFGTAWPVDARGESLADLAPDSEALMYAAPELFETLAVRTTATDVYAIAAIVYRLITGSPPYAGIDRQAISGDSAEEVLAAAAADRTDLSKRTLDLLVAALQTETAWRPHEIDDFGSRLASSLRPRITRPPVTKPIGVEIALPPPIVEVVSETSESDSERRPTEQPEIPFRSLSTERRTPSVSDRSIAWALIVLLLAGALSIPIGQSLLSRPANLPAVATIVSKPAEDRVPLSLKYWIEPGGPNTKENPISDIRRSLAEGLGQLVLETDKSGRAYVLNEITDESGRIGYEMIFPSERASGSSPEVGPGQKLRIGSNVAAKFRASSGIWIVWIAGESDDLESFRAASRDGLIAGDENARRLRHFLERNRNLRLVVHDDETSGRTELSGLGQRIVHRIDLSDL